MSDARRPPYVWTVTFRHGTSNYVVARSAASLSEANLSIDSFLANELYQDKRISELVDCSETSVITTAVYVGHTGVMVDYAVIVKDETGR